MTPAREDVRQALYRLKRQRWRTGFMTWRRGGRLIMRIEPTLPDDLDFQPSIKGEAA